MDKQNMNYYVSYLNIQDLIYNSNNIILFTSNILVYLFNLISNTLILI